jgi:putative ABC transport system permease protein
MTLAAIAFGVAALIVTGGFVQDLYHQLAESIIHSQTGHLQIAQPALFAEGSRSPEKHRIADAAGVQAELARIPGVADAMGRLAFVGLLSNGRSDLPIVGEGIEPDKEARLTTSVTLLSGRPLTQADRRGALLGEGLAKALKVKPGDFVTLIGSTVDGSVNTVEREVTGIFRTYSKDYDARAVKIPLEAAQELLDTPDVNIVIVMLRDTAQTDAVIQQVTPLMVARGLAVKSWQQLNDFYPKTVTFYDRQFGVLTAIILFMVVLGVTNAVNMAVFERVGEFGTMRALGNRSGYTVRLIMLECTLLGAIGAACGVAGGVAMAMLISTIGIPMPPPPNSNSGYIAMIALVPGVIVEAFLVGLTATILAGPIPALRVRRMAIVDALQRSV